MNTPPIAGELVQIGVVTQDLDAAMGSYELLGVGPFHRLDTDYRARFRGRDVQIANRNAFGAWQGAIHVEIIEPVKGEGVQMDWLRNRGGGIFHLAYATDDLTQRLGADVVFESLDSGVVFLDTVGQLGYYVELLPLEATEKIAAWLDAIGAGNPQRAAGESSTITSTGSFADQLAPRKAGL